MRYSHPTHFDRQIAAPLWLTVALVAYTFGVAPFTVYGDTWAVVPVFGLLAGVVALHVRLMVLRQPRWQFVEYGCCG